MLNNSNNKRSNKRVIPYFTSPALLRTDFITRNLKQGVNRGTILQFLKHFDMLKGIPLEYLHTFLLGIIPIILKIIKDRMGTSNFEQLFLNFAAKFKIPSNFRRFSQNIIIFKKISSIINRI